MSDVHGHLQNRFQGFLQPQSREDQQPGTPKIAKLVLGPSQIALHAGYLPRLVNSHGCLVDKIIQH